MTKYRVLYGLSSDYEMIVEAKDKDDAWQKAALKIDPNNDEYWWEIKYVTKFKEINND